MASEPSRYVDDPAEPIFGGGGDRTSGVLAVVRDERERQDTKWGQQNHPDGTGVGYVDAQTASMCKQNCNDAFAAGSGTWRHILLEEVAEAFAEKDPDKLRAELVQVAAVAVAWIEAIDRRKQQEATDGK